MEEKDEKFLKRRFLELANVAYQRAIPVFSDFLTLYEQDILLNMIQTLPPVNHKLFGGSSFVERNMVCFTPKEIDYDISFPIDIIRVAPLNKKFSDQLSHRDLLGAIMNTGIERDVIGDIFLVDGTGYVYVHEKISRYLCENLFKVKHTNVSAVVVNDTELSIKPAVKEITGTVSSVRLDSVCAVAFSKSRTTMQEAVSGGRVFVNGRLITSNGYTLKNGDRISVRGLGKYEFVKVSGTSKKGKSIVHLNIYI
jgi:RNA-binding protein YlmH